MPKMREAGASGPVWRRTLRWTAALAVLCPTVLLAVLPEPHRIEDINPGSASSYRPYLPTGSFWVDAEPVALGSRWIFHADDGVSGLEPWVSDGTEDGTHRILDLCPGPNGSFPELNDGTWFAQEMVVYQGAAYFIANDCANHGYELWRTDGTAAGTTMVKDITPGANSSGIDDLQVLGDRLFFRAWETFGGDREVWRSDGTLAGTEKLPFLNPHRMQDYAWLDGYLYFPWDGGTGGDFEIWRSNGTAGGTTEFVDVNPSGGSYTQELLVFDGRLYFDANSDELWVSDGTVAGTTIFRDNLYVFGMTLVGDRFYFAVDFDQLWVSDGTPGGTQMLKDFGPDSYAAPRFFTGAADQVFFTVDDGVHAIEVWVTDGTAAGTHMVEDVYPGGDYFSDPEPRNLTFANGMAFFTAEDGVHGRELWRSDGSEAGTFMVEDIMPGGDSTPTWLTEVGGTLFFSAWNTTWGREPYKLEISRPLLIQLDEAGSSGVISQEYESAQSIFDCMAADDFSVPSAEAPWDLGLLHVEGFYDSGSGTPPRVNVQILQSSAGLPGAIVCSYDGLGVSSQVQENGGDLTIQLSQPCTLGTGDYWLSVQADMDFASGGHWLWQDRSAQSGFSHTWQNPADGFGYGCTTWAPGNSCHPPSGPDLLFSLYGPAGCVDPWLIQLTAHDVTATESYTACDTLRTTDGLTVTPTGRLLLDARTVILEDGLAISGWLEAGRGL